MWDSFTSGMGKGLIGAEKMAFFTILSISALGSVRWF